MSESNVWTHGVDTVHERQHFAEKPIFLVTKAIKNSSDEGDIIFDPFVGSGTSIIAAEQTGRTCYAIELDPRYIDVAIARWEGLTGEKAVKL
jgi:DNA modification methylase